MCKKLIKQIYKTIVKYDTIVISRHVGADPDALASSIALRDSILATFPSKKVYTIGCPASRFRYLGEIDKIDEGIISDALLIVTDTPDMKRIDGFSPSKYKCCIKIDHHPFVEEYASIEWIDSTSSSASQMVIELLLNTKLVLNESIASKLYLGVVADTNRFLFSYTSGKTFKLVSELINRTGMSITTMYDNLYLRPLKEVRFEAFIVSNMKLTDNGVAYLKITEDMLEEYDVDAATAGNMVNNFNFINEYKVWALFSIDKNNGNTIRGSIRSRGPIINETAAKFGGGGHIYASGVRLSDFDMVDSIVHELDLVCMEYNKETSK